MLYDFDRPLSCEKPFKRRRHLRRFGMRQVNFQLQCKPLVAAFIYPHIDIPNYSSNTSFGEQSQYRCEFS
jgi:hypothetical protein